MTHPHAATRPGSREIRNRVFSEKRWKPPFLSVAFPDLYSPATVVIRQNGRIGLTFKSGTTWDDAPSGSDAYFVRLFRKTSTVFAWFAILLAVAGLASSIGAYFWPENPFLPASAFPCQPPAPLLSVLFAGLAALSVPSLPRQTRWLQAAMGTCIFLLGIVSEAPLPGSQWELHGFSEWLVLLIGFSVGAGASRMTLVGYVRQFSLFVLFFLCGLIVIGHIFETAAESLYMLNYVHTPWTVALASLLVGHALLFQHPNFGIMRLVSGTGVGCHIMRRLLPSVIGLLVFLGWLLAYGEAHAWYPPSFGEALYAILAVAGFTGIMLFTAASLNRLDDERHERELELRRSQAQLQSVLDQIPSIICMKDPAGRYRMVNASFVRATGKSAAECSGKTAFELFPAATAEAIERGYRNALETQGAVSSVEVFPLPTGSRTYLTAHFPLLNLDGEAYAVCGVYTEITDIKRQEEEIQRLNLSLQEKTIRQEAANSELEAFSYSVSHDLRAPLRHIAGFGQLLAQRNRDKLDEKSLHYLDVIQTSVTRMGLLIDDLLSFSRASKVELSPKRIDTNDLVAEVRAELEAQNHGHPVAWETGDLPDMQGDPAMMRLVWVNLLSNAVKYSSKNPQPRITLAFGPVGDEPAVFSVRDNGAGFDMRYADKLFGVFQRLHSNQEYEGTGIGLAMVRRILERHGGRIWAKSAPGEGACFYFVVPVAPPATAAAERGSP